VNTAKSLAAICGLLVSSPAWAQGQAAPVDRDRPRRAAEALSAMRASLRQVTVRAEDARNEKDVVKLNCVNEKLSQIKGLLKVAEQSEVAFKDAVANNAPAANAEFTKIGIAKTKIDGLGNDAQQCIGQLAYIVDEKTTVEVQQPVGQSELETSGSYRAPRPPSAPVVMGPAASPFR
jgi:hypothetical protein